MKQGTLSFQYEEEKRTGGTTGLGGLGVYVEMAQAMGLRGWVERHVGVRAGGQGWRDSEVVMALVLLNLAGGESVGDVEVLEKDEGFCRILRQAEGYGKGGLRERRGEGRRWRRGRRRGVPSASAVFRYLEGFHEAGEEGRREAHRAFIPVANGALRGLWKVNGDMVGFVQRHEGQREATQAFNLNSAMKRLIWGAPWSHKRLKALRFALISLPGRVVQRARRLIIRLARGHPAYPLLLRARQRILALAHAPPPA